MNRKISLASVYPAFFLMAMTLFSSSCINRVDRWTGSPGIVLTQEDDVTRIKKILPATLRGNGTLLEGDILYSVDGLQASGTPLSTVGEALKGPVGTTVTVVVQRNGQYVELRLERVMNKQPEIRVLWIEQISVSSTPPPPPSPSESPRKAPEETAASPK